jgi:hypothetical protein
MTREDATFYGRLALVSGPALIVGGWLAAFTDVGLAFILAGSVMLLASPLLLHSLKAAVLALTLLVLAWTWPYLLVGA